MSRLVLYLFLVVGLGYGLFSLFRPGDGPPDLSGEGRTEGPRAGVPAGDENDENRRTGAAVSAREAGDPAVSPPTEKPAELERRAAEELSAAGKATNREASLKKKDAARRLLSRAFFLTPPGPAAEALRKRVEVLNEEVLFSEYPSPDMSFLHHFAPNDRLWTLCYKVFPKKNEVRVEPGFLLWMNGIADARRIQEGQILKVPQEELSILVSKTRFRLYVLLGGVYLREFAIGIGKLDKTPEGVFEIETKVTEPAWFSPEGRKIAFGHPDNPLGTRWMGFKRTRRAAGYGIHGTSAPDSIGKAVSEGCVRMRNREVEELFEWAARGTKVSIVR